MPRKPIDYKDTLIYKIVCKDLSITDLYIGHTTSFRDRKKEHKSRCNNQYPYLIYKTINNYGGWDNWEMIEVEKYSCNDANEARARERYWYECFNAKLNSKCPTLNIERQQENRHIYLREYYKANKDKLSENHKEYREANKDKLSETRKEYREANKEKIKAYFEANKEELNNKKKAYREANKEQSKEYQKKYRKENTDKLKVYYEANKEKKKAYNEANKDKIKAQRKERYEASKVINIK